MAYALLEEGASYAEWLNACAALNKITFTVADAEEGIEILRFGEARRADLDGFIARFQDTMPEMVTAAITARFNLVAEAEECGVDLKTSNPGVYAKMLTGPLVPEDFDIFPAFVDAED